MKVGDNYEIDLFQKQKKFTLKDVEIDTKININAIFIDKQEELAPAKLWLELTSGDVGLDIETRGLDPHSDEIIMLQFGDLHRQFVIDTRVVDVSEIVPLIVNKQTTIIGQNLKFEYKFFKHNYNLLLENVKDTMIQELCLYNGYKLRNDLKSLSKRYLNYEPNKDIRMRFLEIGNKPFNKDEIIYGAYDVVLPILISNIQEIKLKERNQQILLEHEHEYLKVLGDMEYRGLYLDKNKWKVLYWENKVKYEESLEILNKFIIDQNLEEYFDKQLDMFNTDKDLLIEWSSPKQVVELFTKLEICPKEVSKTTNKLSYTVNAAVLKASLTGMNSNIKAEYKKLIKDYIKMKEFEQRVTTFGVDFFKYINTTTGRLHSNFFQIKSTGRSSSSNPNLQNIPSDSRYRECFISEEGYNIVNADFSGQENIILVNKSLDKDLISFYKAGYSDMHSFIASKIYNKPYEDYINAVRNKENGKTLTKDEIVLLEERTIAKAAGFAINYGGNGYTISKNLGITPKQGDYVYNAYFKAFPGLKSYFDKVINKTLKDGYIHINDVTNRRLNLIDYKRMVSYAKNNKKITEYNKLKGKISRLALNAPIQGTAADITKHAAIRFRKWIVKEGLHDEVWITNIIHDEINVECSETIAQLVAQELEKCMVKAGSIWCKTIPLKAKAVIGTYWGH